MNGTGRRRDEPAIKACLRDYSFAIEYPDTAWDIFCSRVNCCHFLCLSLFYTFCRQRSSNLFFPSRHSYGIVFKGREITALKRAHAGRRYRRHEPQGRRGERQPDLPP
jgi:hypothetical protein